MAKIIQFPPRHQFDDVEYIEPPKLEEYPECNEPEPFILKHGTKLIWIIALLSFLIAAVLSLLPSTWMTQPKPTKIFKNSQIQC